MSQPASSRPAPLPEAATELARSIARIQQTKDTVTIVCMNLLLLVPIAWPGLVLYALRWRLTRRGTPPSPTLWGLTLLHEMLCFWLFADTEPGSDMAGLELFAISYVLGTLLSAAGLITALSPPAVTPPALPADAD